MSLINKLFLIFSITAIFLLMVIVTISTNIEKNELKLNLQNKIDYNKNIYSHLIASLLFDLNKDSIQTIIYSIFKDIDVVKIELIDYSDTINIKIKKDNYLTHFENNILLTFKDEKLGELIITYTNDNINKILSDFVDQLIVLSILFAFILFLIIGYFVYKMTNSLVYLSDATKQIAHGNLSHKLNIKGNDEIAVLAQNFNIMQEALDKRISIINYQLEFQNILLDTINVGVYVKDKDKNFTIVNKKFENFLGINKNKLIGNQLKYIINDKYSRNLEESDDKILNGKRDMYNHTKLYNKDKILKDIISFKSPLLKDGKISGIIGSIYDTSAITQAQNKIRIFLEAIEQSPVSIIILDKNFQIEYVNKYFKYISGFTLNDIKGNVIDDLQDINSNIIYDEIMDTIKQKNIWSGEIKSFKKNGTSFLEYAHFSSILNKDNDIENYLIVKEDITRKKEQEEILLHNAKYDILTNLPNRVLFNDRLEQVLKNLSRNNYFIAVLFIDLDNFKNINDTLGHSSGDEVLKEASQRLLSCVREEDTVSRFGGDEFVLLLTGLNKYYNIVIVLNKILEKFREPFIIKNRKFYVTASIGVATNKDIKKSAQQLQSNADLAMYRAKKLGKNNYVYFNETLNDELNRRLKIKEKLLDALKNKELKLYFQSQFSIKTNKIITAEALIRWKSNLFDNISPEEFIPIAEESDLINKIGEFVISECIGLLKKLEMLNIKIKISINISPKQLLDANIINYIQNELLLKNVNPKYLELEITEGILMNDSLQTRENLNSLKNIGLSIALDDFGTGYSSLSYLRKYPFDILKIDKSFIDLDDYSLINTIITLSHSMSLKVVAEGVENKKQLDLLKNLNCDIAQGNFFSKPLNEKDFIKYLQNLS